MTRVSTFSQNNLLLNEVLRNERRVFNAQNQISTGLKSPEFKGAYILNLTGGNPALASVGTNVTQRPMNGKTTLRRPHCN